MRLHTRTQTHTHRHALGSFELLKASCLLEKPPTDPSTAMSSLQDQMGIISKGETHLWATAAAGTQFRGPVPTAC
jgi:hypothetical protein